jgi:hypothetical protein
MVRRGRFLDAPNLLFDNATHSQVRNLLAYAAVMKATQTHDRRGTVARFASLCLSLTFASVAIGAAARGRKDWRLPAPIAAVT